MPELLREEGGGRGTDRVSVHEAPDGGGHFTRKQDHQEEEEL